MDVTKLKERINIVIDDWADEQKVAPSAAEVPEAPARELPKNKRLVVTKSSGDRKYELDEIKKTRSWVASPEVLEALGWKMEDAVMIEDSELLKYQTGSAIYRVETA